jgi:hypothetical protein
MKIFIDDQCHGASQSWIPEGYVGVVNFAEFEEKLKEAQENGESIEGISFDNDLGEGELEGWEIARWLTREHPEIFTTNPELNIHSANPQGRESIGHYLTLGKEHHQELIEAKNTPNPWGEVER